MIAIRSAVVFAAAFAVAYVVAVEANLAAFTYYPRLSEWDWGRTPSREGPAMYYYGWLFTATGVAGFLTLLGQPLIRRFAVPLWLGWLVPLAAMLSFIWFLRGFFWR